MTAAAAQVRGLISERREVVRDLHFKGFSSQQIADQIGGISTRTVLRDLQALKLPSGSRRFAQQNGQYSNELVERVRQLYSSGLSMTNVAAATGTTAKVLHRLMRRHGIARRPPGGWSGLSISERFWTRVVQRGDCWIWQGKLRCGYGTFNIGWGCTAYAHRWAYEELRCKVPTGLQLDHLCRNRTCVNPWHLDPVTTRINILRGDGLASKNATKTHCPQGHAYDVENTYTCQGQRFCRACRRNRS